jgi:hypothetical protein
VRSRCPRPSRAASSPRSAADRCQPPFDAPFVRQSSRSGIRLRARPSSVTRLPLPRRRPGDELDVLRPPELGSMALSLLPATGVTSRPTPSSASAAFLLFLVV